MSRFSNGSWPSFGLGLCLGAAILLPIGMMFMKTASNDTPSRSMLATTTAATTSGGERRTLTVTGQAETSVVPDLCLVSVSRESMHPTSAATAFENNSKAVAGIVAAAKRVGMLEKDMAMTNLNLSPQYHFDGSTGRNKRVFDGHSVSQHLTLKVRDLTKVSTVLDAAVAAGATEISSVQFTVESPAKAAEDLRNAAYDNALKKAQKIAELTGVVLGKPVDISEVEPGAEGGGRPPVMYRSERMQVAGTMAMDSGAVMPGETKLVHTVTVVYEIL